MYKSFLAGLLVASGAARAQCEFTLAHLDRMANLDASDPKQFVASDLLAGLLKNGDWYRVEKATTADRNSKVVPIRLLAVKVELLDRRTLHLEAHNDFRPALRVAVGHLDDRNLTQVEVTDVGAGYVVEVRTTDRQRLPVQIFLGYSAGGTLERIALHPRFGSVLKMELAPITGT